MTQSPSPTRHPGSYLSTMLGDPIAVTSSLWMSPVTHGRHPSHHLGCRHVVQMPSLLPPMVSPVTQPPLFTQQIIFICPYSLAVTNTVTHPLPLPWLSLVNSHPMEKFSIYYHRNPFLTESIFSIQTFILTSPRSL